MATLGGDPSISLQGPWNSGALAAQQQAGGAAGPGGGLSMLQQYTGLQNSMNQLKMFNQQFQARQAAGQAIAAAPDLDSAAKAVQTNPQIMGFAPEFATLMKGLQSTQQQISAGQQAQAQSGADAFIKVVPAMIADPAHAKQIAAAQYSTLPPEIQKRDGTFFNAALGGMINDLPTDPDPKRQAQLQQQEMTKRGIGYAIAAGQGSNVMQNLVGSATTQNVGNAIQAGVQGTPLQGGGFQPSTSTPVQPAPSLGLAPVGPGGSSVPLSMSIDPATNQPHASIVGGAATPAVATQTPAAAAFSQHRGADMAAYQGNLDTQAKGATQIMQTAQAAMEAMQNFKPGGGAATYQKLAELGQAVGLPDDVVNRLGNGNLPASQEFQKLMVNAVMGQVGQQLPSASRLTQHEFDAFRQNNPNIETDPRAIQKIFQFWQQQTNRTLEEQRGLNAHIRAGGDPSEWPEIWNQELQNRGLTLASPASTAGPPSGNVPQGSAPPSAASYKSLDALRADVAAKKWTPAQARQIAIQSGLAQ